MSDSSSSSPPTSVPPLPHDPSTSPLFPPPPSPSLLPPSPSPSSPPPSSPSSTPNMTHFSVFCAPKAGMSSVDTSHVNAVVYSLSKDSAHFRHQQSLASKTAVRIAQMQRRIAAVRSSPPTLLSHLTARAHTALTSLESERDLTHTWLHIDLDAFYAQVELLTRPDLRHLPVAVGGLSMLTTSNYVARQFGVRAAMPGFIALKLCPQLVLLPCDFRKYTACAAVFRRVFAEYDPGFETGSLDEAYLDVTAFLERRRVEREGAGEWDQGREAQAVASEIRRRVLETTQLTCSCGIACNRMLAKIATDVNKPNGQFYLEPTLPAILNFISPMPIRKVPGVGKVQERILHELGIQSVGDMRDDRFAPLLVELFSEGTARWLFAVSLGLGRSVHEDEEERKRKSVSCERTFKDIDRLVEFEDKVEDISRHLADDVARAGVKGHTLTLKMKTSTFEVKQRSVTLQRWVSSYDDLHRLGLGLLKDELNLLLSGQKLKKSAKVAAQAGGEGGLGLGRGRGRDLARSPFDGLLRLRLMGLRLSALSSERGEETAPEGEATDEYSILRYAKPVRGSAEEDSDVVSEASEPSAVKRRRAGDADISRYFSVPSPTQATGQEDGDEVVAEAMEMGRVRGGAKKSRRSIVHYFHQAAAASTSADDDIEELMREGGEGEVEDWVELLEDGPRGSVTSPPLLSSPPPQPPPASAPLATAVSVAVSSDAEATCPVCEVKLGRGLSNSALNGHIDRCLQGQVMGKDSEGEHGRRASGSQRPSGKSERGMGKRRAAGGIGKASSSLMDLWQRK